MEDRSYYEEQAPDYALPDEFGRGGSTHAYFAPNDQGGGSGGDAQDKIRPISTHRNWQGDRSTGRQEASTGQPDSGKSRRQTPASGFKPPRTITEDLQLPDPLFRDFKLLLKMQYTVEKGETSAGLRRRSYTRVKNMKGEFRALIYLSGKFLTEKDLNSANANAVISLGADFGQIPFIVFTESRKYGREIKHAVEKIGGRIVLWHEVEDLKIDDKIEKHKEWVRHILDMEV